jgi:hypothetical protein
MVLVTCNTCWDQLQTVCGAEALWERSWPHHDKTFEYRYSQENSQLKPAEFENGVAKNIINLYILKSENVLIWLPYSQTQILELRILLKIKQKFLTVWPGLKMVVT